MNHIQDAFLNTLKVERNFSEHTLKSYQDDLIQFNQFLEQEHLELNTFEYRDARNYLSYLYSNHLKRTSVSRKISTLRTFYEYWFNQFLEQEHLELNTFEYRDARNYLIFIFKSFEKNICFS